MTVVVPVPVPVQVRLGLQLRGKRPVIVVSPPPMSLRLYWQDLPLLCLPLHTRKMKALYQQVREEEEVEFERRGR